MHTLTKNFKTWVGFSWVSLLGISFWLLSISTDTPLLAQTDSIDCPFNATIPPASLALTVTEGGPSAFYSITLCTEPEQSVKVNLHISEEANRQLAIFPLDHEIYFDNKNWNTPQPIEVKPRDDTVIERATVFTIAHSLTSEDENFNHPKNEVPEVKVLLDDNERGNFLPVIVHQPLPTATPTPRWQQIATTPPHVDVLRTNNNQLFAGDRSDDPNARGIYRSSACTVNAAFKQTLGSTRIQDFSFTDQFGLAATNGDRVYYTSNNGESWQRTNSAMNQFAFAVAFTDGPAYAGTDDGIYSSTNNGATWIKVNPLGNGPSLINVFTYSKAENILWIGTYGGGVWKHTPGSNLFTQVIGGLADPDSDRRVWDILRRSAGEFYIATTNGVYKGDGTGNWTAFGLQKQQILSLEIVGTSLYAGLRDGGIQQTPLGSTDAWTPMSGIDPKLTVRDLFYDQSGPCKALLAGTTNGIWVYR